MVGSGVLRFPQPLGEGSGNKLLRRRTKTCLPLNAQCQSSSSAGAPSGGHLSDFEQSEIGPELFPDASTFGLEGLVSRIAVDQSRRPVKALDQVEEPPALER
jgi:hypothetical protein